MLNGDRSRAPSPQIGRSLEAFTELRFNGDARVDTIAAIGDGIPEVQAVFTMAGDPDALVWLRVRDVHDLKRVIDQLRGTGRVAGTKTMMVLAATTYPTPVPSASATEG